MQTGVGVCSRLIAITSRPQGALLVLDYDFESSTAKLVSVRLHKPAEVSVKNEGYKDARDICYNNGIAFVPERGSGVISFVDFGGCVMVKVDALKGEISRKFAVISKPKNVCLSGETMK